MPSTDIKRERPTRDLVEALVSRQVQPVKQPTDDRLGMKTRPVQPVAASDYVERGLKPKQVQPVQPKSGDSGSRND